LRTLLNVVWLVLAGLWLALGYAIAGVIMCILIVTIPFGLQAFKLARYSLWPFGRTVVKRPEAGGTSVVGNIIWLLLAGWWLALLHLASALLLAITIIGLPLAVANVTAPAAPPTTTAASRSPRTRRSARAPTPTRWPSATPTATAAPRPASP
jgi:uncharacterized membrane protein YccF (DUF307 family)